MNTCRDFSKGVCPFVESVCWYKHREAVITEVSNTFKCNICDEGYTNKSEIMFHKKQKHRVSECKTNITGTCWFGEEKCWFAHYKIKENDENGKMIEIKTIEMKMIKMKMTKKILKTMK